MAISLKHDFWPAVRLVSMHNFRFARDPGTITKVIRRLW